MYILYQAEKVCRVEEGSPSWRVRVGEMEKMKQSELKTHEITGKRCLIVYYSQERDDYMEAIAEGERLHGIRPGSVAAIAKPRKPGKIK